ncbi:MAG: 4Fe-4S binding protein [Deltaproteobacteria bacterium]|nr:4Fe-4S binding protein [Deltaproteobacteria bacterium]MBN2672258.1 4Fe-4S binding protein [Deltaproteobacteria bacterium]
MKTDEYLKNVVTLSLNETACNGCSTCLQVCPHQVFIIRNKKAIIARKDGCMECGACQRNCEQGAITVQTGVGCAAAIINSVFSKSNTACCDC